ncbi:hypothetical protein scyTo_0016161, partial [Scyliorhinus torazame]|nr:hypothetical protein [Scyliorhinus torazame]
QHLTLVAIKAAVIRELQLESVERGTLKYHFDKKILHRPIKLMKPQNVEKVILETLKNLELHNQEKVHADTPAKFLQLVQLLRSTTDETIASVWRHSDSSQLRMTPLFSTLAGGKMVSKLDLSRACQQLLFEEDLKRYLTITTHKELFKYNWLFWGPLHDLLTAATAQANEEDIALGLKAIGNAGQPASIKNIMKLLPGFGTAAASIPLKLQVDALMSLRNIAKKDPAKVGFRMEGLQEVMTKSRAGVRRVPDMRQIHRILNGFPDWKSLPEKVPLASAYMKLLDQEIAFVEFRKDDIRKAIQCGCIQQSYHGNKFAHHPIWFGIRGECIAESERVVTFDSNELKYKIVNDCHYVLTKDCSPTPKFVLLMRRAKDQLRKRAIKLLISVPNIVIEAYPTTDGIKLLVDNVETTLSKQGNVIQSE